jgi:hypothetical protein
MQDHVAMDKVAVRSWRDKLSFLNKELNKYINILSSKGIEPFTAINQFFYRESPLPIGSPALNFYFFNLFYFYNHPLLDFLF